MGMKRVLIIEDEKDVRDVIAEIVDLIGYETVCCSDAESALLEMGRANFDLVITDLGLPGMDGAEFIKKVRLTDADTPILVIAGVDLDQSDIDMRKMTNWSFVQKPFTLDGIRGKMAELLRRSSTAQSKTRMKKGTIDR